MLHKQPPRTFVDAAGQQYYAPPYSAFNLEPDLRHGLIALGTFATLSAVSTSALLSFLLWRFIGWRRHYRIWVGYNQYVVLVLNLLVAGESSSRPVRSWQCS